MACDQDLHCLLAGIFIWNRIKMKNTPDTPQMTKVLVQFIRMDEYTTHLWRNFCPIQKEASLTENVKQKAFLYELCLTRCKGDNSNEDLDRVMAPDLYRKMWLYRIQDRVQTMEVRGFYLKSVKRNDFSIASQVKYTKKTHLIIIPPGNEV